MMLTYPKSAADLPLGPIARLARNPVLPPSPAIPPALAEAMQRPTLLLPRVPSLVFPKQIGKKR